MNPGRGRHEWLQGLCTVFGRSPRDLFDDCASCPGRLWSAEGSGRAWGPSLVSLCLSCEVYFAHRCSPFSSCLRSSISCGFISLARLIDPVLREEEKRAKQHVKEFGRRSARPSIRPLLVDGEFPALGVCGGGKRMQAAFLGAPSRDKCRVSTTSCFQKPKPAAWDSVYSKPLPDTLVFIHIPDDDSTVAQVVLDATDE